MSEVTTTEAIHVRVAAWLKQKGHQIQLIYGVPNNSKDSFSVYITCPEPRRFLGFEFGCRKDEYRIADLYLRDNRVGATGKNWVIEVYGRQHLQQITNMAKELAKEFEVKIHVRLEEERPQFIVYDRSYD